MMTVDSSAAQSPDGNAAGFTAEKVDALRYDGQSDHPSEVAGILKAMMPSKLVYWMSDAAPALSR